MFICYTLANAYAEVLETIAEVSKHKADAESSAKRKTDVESSTVSESSISQVDTPILLG